jgi:hypothetical protein
LIKEKERSLTAFTLSEVINLATQSCLLLCLVSESFRSFPQFDGVASFILACYSFIDSHQSFNQERKRDQERKKE